MSGLRSNDVSARSLKRFINWRVLKAQDVLMADLYFLNGLRNAGS